MALFLHGYGHDANHRHYCERVSLLRHGLVYVIRLAFSQLNLKMALLMSKLVLAGKVRNPVCPNHLRL